MDIAYVYLTIILLVVLWCAYVHVCDHFKFFVVSGRQYYPDKLVFNPTHEMSLIIFIKCYIFSGSYFIFNLVWLYCIWDIACFITNRFSIKTLKVFSTNYLADPHKKNLQVSGKQDVRTLIKKSQGHLGTVLNYRCAGISTALKPFQVSVNIAADKMLILSIVCTCYSPNQIYLGC